MVELKCSACGRPIPHNSNGVWVDALLYTDESGMYVGDPIRLYCRQCVKVAPAPSFCEACKHGQNIHDRGVCTLDKNNIDTHDDFLDECAAARHGNAPAPIPTKTGKTPMEALTNAARISSDGEHAGTPSQGVPEIGGKAGEIEHVHAETRDNDIKKLRERVAELEHVINEIKTCQFCTRAKSIPNYGGQMECTLKHDDTFDSSRGCDEWSPRVDPPPVRCQPDGSTCPGKIPLASIVECPSGKLVAPVSPREDAREASDGKGGNPGNTCAACIYEIEEDHVCSECSRRGNGTTDYWMNARE